MNLNEIANTKTVRDKYLKSCVTHEETETEEIFIFNDEEPMNPRIDQYNLGTIIYSSSSYLLGDKQVEKGTTPESYCKTKKLIAVPVYAYVHSGICLDTKPFSCQWDSGQSGYIVATFDDIRKWYMVKRVTKAIKAKAIRALHGEVETFSKYLSGTVYGFQRFDKATGEEKDSCWGIYDSPNEIIKQVKAGGY